MDSTLQRRALLSNMALGHMTPEEQAKAQEGTMARPPEDPSQPPPLDPNAQLTIPPLQTDGPDVKTGSTTETTKKEMPPADGTAPIDYGKSIGQYTGGKYFGDYNADKFNDFGHDSPKYQVLRALSHFDPSQGVTPEVLNALNSLHLGTFSGSGDKVTLTNGDPRWDGMNSADLITDFGGKNQWGVQGDGPGWNQEAAQGQMGAGPIAESSLLSSLTSGGTAGADDLFKKLMAQARGIAGLPSMDRGALLSLLQDQGAQ